MRYEDNLNHYKPYNMQSCTHPIYTTAIYYCYTCIILALAPDPLPPPVPPVMTEKKSYSEVKAEGEELSETERGD